MIPELVDAGCRDDLVRIDGDALPVRVVAPVADLLAGEAIEAMPCGPEGLRLEDGLHRLTTPPGTHSGVQVDRVVLSDRPAPATEGSPTVTVESQDRLSRRVTVDGCPEGCWLVLGEGFHESWSAEVAEGDLGPPQLVDGGFNGWWIPPSDEPTEVNLRWTAQTPLNIALLLTVLAVLACIALAILDRRRLAAPAPVPAARFATRDSPVPMRIRWIAAVAWIVAAALFVGWGWALVAAAAAAVLVVGLGRPRLAGLVTMGIVTFIGAVIVWVVHDERPWPDAGWPARFEWLHGLGLFAAVALAVSSASAPSPLDGRRR